MDAAGPLDAVRRVAPDDVRDAIDRLLSRGFSVVSVTERHGMGFAEVTLQQDDVKVALTSDRDQWMCEITNGPGPAVHLVALLVARGVLAKEPGLDVDLKGPMPKQLPVGVSWRKELPASVEWVSEADRSKEIAHAWELVKSDRMRRWRSLGTSSRD